MASSPRIEELRKKFEDNPRRYFAPLANEYRKAGDLEQAIALCRTHLRDQPTHMSGHIVFGQALFESGEREEARQIFEAALALDPENLIALRHLGDIARMNDDSIAARTWYERVLEADPRNDEIAALLQELGPAPSSAVVEVPPAVESDALSGWGDINPEQSDDTLRVPSETPTRSSSQDIRVEFTPEFEDTTAVMDRASILSQLSTMGATPPAPPQPAAQDSLLDIDGDDFSLDMGGSAGMAPLAAEPNESRSAMASGRPTMPQLERLQEFDAESLADELATTVPSSPFVPELTPQSDDLELDAAFGTAPQESFASALTDESAPEVDAAETDEALTPADQYGAARTMEFVPLTPMSSPTVAADDEAESEADATPAAFVTETMAELYLQQGFYDEALDVYRQLLAQSPNDDELRERVRQLESGTPPSVLVTSVAKTTVVATEDRPGTQRTPTVRSFFGILAGRRAPGYEVDASPQSMEGPGASHSGSSAADSGESAASAYDDASGGVAVDVESPDEMGRTEELETSSAADDENQTTSESSTQTLSSWDTGATAFDSHRTLERTDRTERPEIAPHRASDEPQRSRPLGGFAPEAMLMTPAQGMTALPDVRTPRGLPGGSVDALFAGAPVDSQDEARAAALADVYGRAERRDEPMPGRPTRAASTELSLDHVFREPQQGRSEPRRESGNFSFDQFFSPGATGAVRPTGPAPSAPPPRSGDEAGDIEQFTAWLEGLKKS